MGLPAGYPVHLVGTHHEGGLVHFEDVKGLVGLGFETLVEVHHQHRQVSQGPTPFTEGGEGLMAGSVNEEQDG